MQDSPYRSLLKGLTWRAIATVSTMVVVYLMTGNLGLMATVGLSDVTFKMVFYYMHERLWGRVRWGRIGVEPNL